MIGSGMVAENSIDCRAAGDLAQDPFDIGQEAEIQHLVGLVEHEHGDAAQLQVALLREVQQPAGRADDDVGAGLQRVDLWLVGPSTVDRHDGQLAILGSEVLRRDGQVARHLQAQLAGRHNDECAGDATQRAVGVVGDALQQRHTEGVGLAHPGAGLADQIVAGQRERQRQLLNGK